jgi:hypothetical protein
VLITKNKPSPLEQLPPERLSVIVAVPDPLIEEILGIELQVLEDKLKLPLLAITAVEKVTVIVLGIEVIAAKLLGEVLLTCGPVFCSTQ